MHSDPTKRLRFDGQAVLVTGGSRGIGRSIADTLHALGATVYATSRSVDEAAGLAERYGTPPIVLDIADSDSIRSAVDEVFRHSPDLAFVVNNAGMNRPEVAENIRIDDWDAMFDVNVRGTFLVSQACANRWIPQGIAGSICNISSQAGRVALEKRTAYSSTKAAVDQMTRNLAFEWAPHKIRVNGIAPTFVETELTAATLSDPAFRSELVSRIPLGRLGEPQEIADAVAFVLSPMASMITGQTILVDGGYTIR